MTAAERRSIRYVLSELEWEHDEMQNSPLGMLWADWRDALRDVLEAVAS